MSIYDAKSDAQVPGLGPVFKALGKRCYGLHDTPNSPFPPTAATDALSFDSYLQIPYKSIEELLIAEMPDRPKRAFLRTVTSRQDYPIDAGTLPEGAGVAEVDSLVRDVLLKRKGAYYGYAAMLVAEAADVTELPSSYVQFLLDVDADLAAANTSSAPPSANANRPGPPTPEASVKPPGPDPTATPPTAPSTAVSGPPASHEVPPGSSTVPAPPCPTNPSDAPAGAQ